jgi:nucleotide-binding universal stress UspA family protein
MAGGWMRHTIEVPPLEERTVKRILIATDGSPAAKQAVEVGVELAASEGAMVLFVHVVPVADIVATSGFGLMAPVHHPVAASDEQLLDDAAEVADRADVPASVKLLRGNTVDEIVAHADSMNADLIVVGSRGHGAITSALLGSVSRGVLAESRRPVMIVRSVPVAAPAAV